MNNKIIFPSLNKIALGAKVGNKKNLITAIKRTLTKNLINLHIRT